MMYASKTEIRREPQKVKYTRKVELPDRLLTIDDITKHLKEGEKFGIRESDVGFCDFALIMTIVGYRLETQQELEDRIERQERYNANYEKHHAKYGRK